MTARDQTVHRLSLGIKGICRTKRARRHSRLRLLSVLLVLSLVIAIPVVIRNFTLEPSEPQWQGRLIVLCGSASIYDVLFYRLYPSLLPSFDLTQASFESKINLTLCPKSQYKDMVTQYGLEDYLDPESLPSLNRTFYLILLDENQTPLYLGTDETQVIEFLRPILSTPTEGGTQP